MKHYLIREIVENDLDELMLLIEEHAAYEKAHYTIEGKKQLLKNELFGKQKRLNCYVIVIEKNKLLFIEPTSIF